MRTRQGRAACCFVFGVLQPKLCRPGEDVLEPRKVFYSLQAALAQARPAPHCPALPRPALPSPALPRLAPHRLAPPCPARHCPALPRPALPTPPRLAHPAPPRPATPPALCCEVSLLADAVCARRRCGVGAAATSRSARRRCAVHRRALPRLMGELTLRDDSKRWWNGAARALCSKCQRSGEYCADAAAAAPVQSRVLHRAELQRVQRAHASARQPARALAVSMQRPSGT